MLCNVIIIIFFRFQNHRYKCKRLEREQKMVDGSGGGSAGHDDSRSPHSDANSPINMRFGLVSLNLKL